MAVTQMGRGIVCSACRCKMPRKGSRPDGNGGYQCALCIKEVKRAPIESIPWGNGSISVAKLAEKYKANGINVRIIYQRWHRGDRGERLVRPPAPRSNAPRDSHKRKMRRTWTMADVSAGEGKDRGIRHLLGRLVRP